MDGNNRWSKKKQITKKKAYLTGAKTLLKCSNYIFENTEANFISAFALSKNNLKRSSIIINSIKSVLLEFLNNYSNLDYNFDINFIGDFDYFGKKIKNKIEKLNKNSLSKKKLIIFLNYGGRQDIENACLNIKNKKKIFNNYLSTKNIPDPEILIRTGGYKRISNFFLYQIAFTELFFLKKLWPDLNLNDLKKIIYNYRNIERKFGR